MKAVVHSRVVVLLLLIDCLLMLSLFVGVLCLVLVFVIQYLMVFLCCITLMWKRAGCFTVIVFLMSCDC